MMVLTSSVLDGLSRRDRMIHGVGNWGPPLEWTPTAWQGYLTRGAVLATVFGHTNGVRLWSSDVRTYAERIRDAVDLATKGGLDPEDHPVVAAIRAVHGLSTSERGVDFAVAHLYALPAWRAIYDPA